jgi:GT2 family glycosyltransferase
MTEASPSISVIIPTHNRARSLRRTLDALAIQCYPYEQLEVVVVGDGCTDETATLLQHYDAPFTLNFIEQPSQGAAAARNQGAAKAAGRVLLFLDDDVEAASSLIDNHARVHETQHGAVVMGPYVPALHGRTDFFRMLMRAWWHDKFSAMREPGHRFTYRDVVSGNLSLSAELFARVGGFDTAFRDCGGEDYEFGARLIRSGAAFFYAPDAMAIHHEHETTDFPRFFRRARQEGRSDVMIGLRHSELIPTLPLFKFEPPRTVFDRLVHGLAFDYPRLGDVLASQLNRLVVRLEQAHCRMLWRRLCGGLRHYWYLRGAAEKLKSQKAFAKFIQNGPHHADQGQGEVEIDLRDGIETAERRMDEERPAGIRISYGKQFIGRIPSHAGAERLRSAHLRPILATNLAWPVLRAQAFQSVFMKGSVVDLLVTGAETQAEFAGGTNGGQGPGLRPF